MEHRHHPLLFLILIYPYFLCLPPYHKPVCHALINLCRANPLALENLNRDLAHKSLTSSTSFLRVYAASKFSITMDTMIVEDEDSHPVLLFQNEWSINMVKERNETAVLKEISFRK